MNTVLNRTIRLVGSGEEGEEGRGGGGGGRGEEGRGSEHCAQQISWQWGGR